MQESRYGMILDAKPASLADTCFDELRQVSIQPKVVSQSFSGGIVPHVPAGGLLLWDSRALHCNTPGGEARGGGEGRAAEPELLRCAVMVRCCVD